MLVIFIAVALFLLVVLLVLSLCVSAKRADEEAERFFRFIKREHDRV